MGLLGKFFGQRQTQKSSSSLFKEATQLKKSGNWDDAIQTLRQAYETARGEGVSFGADTYLKLPKYLYEAGRSDEAWSEYNRMLYEGVDGRGLDSDFSDTTLSQIYGAMAGQLKKGKKFHESVIYQAVAALSWEKSMLQQNRKSELNIDSLEKSIEQTLKKNKAKYSDEFLLIVREALSRPKNHSVTELFNKLTKTNGS